MSVFRRGALASVLLAAVAQGTIRPTTAPRDVEACAAVCGGIKLKCEDQLRVVLAEHQQKLQRLQMQLDEHTAKFDAFKRACDNKLTLPDDSSRRHREL